MKVIIVGTKHNSERARKVIDTIENLGCTALVWDDMAPSHLDCVQTLKEIAPVYSRPENIFPKPESKYHK